MPTPKVKRSKEETAALRETRVADLRGKCEARTGIVCPHACVKGCKRSVTAKKISASRVAKRKAKNDAVAKSIEQRDRIKAKEERDRMAAIRFEAKARKSSDLALEKWQAQVLFLCGHPIRAIAKIIHGDKESRRGPINKIVTQMKLEAIRGVEEQRIKMLVDLDRRSPHGHAGYVYHHAANGPLPRTYDEIQRVRGIVPENKTLIVTSRKNQLARNAGNSALHLIAHKGSLTDAHLHAGLYVQWVATRMPGGGMKSVDFGKIRVQETHRNGTSMDALDAIDEYAYLRELVLAMFADEHAGILRWRIIFHVAVEDRPLGEFDLPKEICSSKALFLSDALEPVACALGSGSDDAMALRVSNWLMPSARSDMDGREADLLEQAIAASRFHGRRDSRPQP